MGGKSGTGGGGQTQRLTGVQVQGKGYGTDIQICFGKNRASPFLVQYENFRAIKAKTAGGKGGGGKGGGGQWEYSADLVFAASEGPIRGYGKIWRDKEVFSPLGTSYIIDGQFALGEWRYGDRPQSSISFLPLDRALPYSGTALIASSNFNLGSGATIGSLSVEVFGLCLGNSGDQNEHDAHIKDVVYTFLADPYFGAISAQSASLSLDMDEMHNYCAALGILISPLVTGQQSAKTWFDEWLTVANTALVWSDGKLKFRPYSEMTVGAYTPDNDIRYHFDDDEIAELMEPERKKPQDCYNVQPVECLNRDANYNKYTYEARDTNDIRLHGLRPNTQTLTLNSVCKPGIAVRVALTQLKRSLYINRIWTIKAHADVDHLEPQDFITISDPDMGVESLRLRIIQIDDDPMTDESNGNITIIAEEAPRGSYDG